MLALNWLALSFIVLLCWGLLGVFQKVAMNRISAPSALAWMALGLMLLQLVCFPGGFAFHYSRAGLGWALLNGVFNGLGMLFLLAAMRQGGKASVVEPLSALYPVAVALLAPILLHETVSAPHAAGILCATIGGILLSAESRAA
jgi:transporter family protein